METNSLASGICDPAMKIIDTYEKLGEVVNAARILRHKIVLTSGSWDFKHIGHDRYLRLAREHGDFLVVGVESDERIKKKKGNDRPIVPEGERVESLAHLQYTNVVFVKGTGDEKWRTIKTVKPDVLIISERTGYNKETMESLKEFCGEIVMLESQAETSTTAKLRKLQRGVLRDAVTKIEEVLDVIKESIK